jgi:hypothetical protein
MINKHIVIFRVWKNSAHLVGYTKRVTKHLAFYMCLAIVIELLATSIKPNEVTPIFPCQF